jgi:hypothetical protein
MHSNLVGDLNVVLVLSVYFGFINSAIHPPYSYKTALYSGILNTKLLIFPGYKLYPLLSVGSKFNYIKTLIIIKIAYIVLI